MTKTSWKQQFLSSLKKLEDEDTEGRFTGSLDKMVDSYFEIKNDEDELLLTGFRAILLQNMHYVWGDFERAVVKCQSPIEIPMLIALTVYGKDLIGSVSYLVDGIKWGDRDDYGDVLSIQPQAQIGEHRVDFLLTLKVGLPDFSNYTESKDGTKIPGFMTVSKQMVVECDGHDFHDRTKEQARNDKARDRTLQSVGYRVFRYTGSEIWEDVFACAKQAADALMEEAYSVP